MKAIRLRPIHGDNRYCGPAVIAALTNGNTDFAAAHLSILTGRWNIAGTTLFELDSCLRKVAKLTFELGERYYHRHWFERPTLAQVLRRENRAAEGVYLVDAGKHWSLLHGERIFDNSMVRAVPIREARTIRKRSRVAAIYRVVHYTEPAY